MSLSGLNAALAGLRIAQQQIDTIGNNVANVSTPGYTRKILPQETVVIDGKSIGVTSNPLLRKVDLNLQRDFWTQVSAVNFLDTQAAYLSRIQEFHGPPDLEKSISAEIAQLRDSFSTLADSPEDSFLQRTTVRQAQNVVDKINGFSSLLNQMRNDTQEEMKSLVRKVNTLLDQIAEANVHIRFNTAVNKGAAALEDQRDMAIKELASYLDVSYFIRGDNVMVVQTGEGVELAGDVATPLFFGGTPVGPESYYPVTASGLYVGGDPAVNQNAIEITEREVGGKLGALIELRDDILPRQQALVDELSHKMAMRFDAQGLRLFTDELGNIPSDAAPVPNPPGPLTPVAYVGFASTIRVNALVLNDNSLVQQGTVATDIPVQAGSNEVARRIAEFAFGEVNYQQTEGAVDLRSSLGGASLQEWLGIFGENQMTGTKDVQQYADINLLFTAGGDVFVPPVGPVLDGFQLTFSDTRFVPAIPDFSVTVSLTNANANFPINPGVIDNAADQIVAEINALLAGAPPEFAAVASLTPSGQIVINSRANITLDNDFIGGMTEEGLSFLGLTEGTVTTSDPYFEVQVGNDPVVRITIEPEDDEFDLLAKLDKIGALDAGVAGLAVGADLTDPLGTGFLNLRPGDSTTNPVFGGDLKILGGPFMTDGTGLIGGGMPAGRTIIEALFGSTRPVTDVFYSSPTANPAVSVPFRSQNLGPGADIDTGVISATNIIDYAQKFVNQQAEEIIAIEARKTDEQSFHDLLQRRLLDESGVNIDEELSQLIVVQTAYAAAARVLSAVDEQFRDLLNAI